MIWGSDRIQTGYNTMIARPSYAKPSYLLTFNGKAKAPQHDMSQVVTESITHTNSLHI